MKARCPQCGLDYLDNFAYCKKDGSRLIRRARRWPYLVAAAVLILGLAGAYAIKAGPPYMQEHLAVQVTGAGLHVPTGGLASDLIFHITNSSRIPASLHTVSSVCSVSGTEFATVEWSPANHQALAIPANGTADLTADVRLRDVGWRDILRAAGGSGEVVCRGSVSVSMLGIRFSHDLSYNSRTW
jgi:hypothetical protein